MHTPPHRPHTPVQVHAGIYTPHAQVYTEIHPRPGACWDTPSRPRGQNEWHMTHYLRFTVGKNLPKVELNVSMRKHLSSKKSLLKCSEDSYESRPTPNLTKKVTDMTHHWSLKWFMLHRIITLMYHILKGQVHGYSKPNISIDLFISVRLNPLWMIEETWKRTASVG